MSDWTWADIQATEDEDYRPRAERRAEAKAAWAAGEWAHCADCGWLTMSATEKHAATCPHF